MKKWLYALSILVLLGLIIGAKVHNNRLYNEATETVRACAALQECYRFLFANCMDRDVPLPITLDESPEWKQYVENTTAPAQKELFRKIEWNYPMEGRTEGKEIAYIDLPHSRAVLLSGGSIFSRKK